MSNSNLIAVAGLCAATLAATLPSAATENGAIAYPIGVNTVMAGAMPGPGETWWQNYSVYYTANSFSNAAGDSSVPGFGADVVVNAFRFFHGWNVDLGPFQLGSAVVIPVMNADVGTAFGSSSNAGIGDITLQPLYLGWSNADHSFFGYAGVDVFVPTGGAISNNFYTINPLAAFTWLPTKTLEVSGAIGFEFHTENSQTNYRSGSLFFIDWGVNYHAFDTIPALAVGVGGYLIKQLSDDELNGVVYQDGFRQQGFAIGPQLSYGTPNGAIAVKWQREFATENRPDGQRFWVQFLLPLKAP
ncbi:transporter [Xanthobacter autotrophicus DSM 431]|uniref:SphA family protein n=1 Tax=Xanthobacter nonsaccharivorans TaxID=3119912 RepID=UPI00372835A8